MDLSTLVGKAIQPFKSKVLTGALLMGLSVNVAMAQEQEPSKAKVMNNIVGTETTITLSESERAIPEYSDKGNYDVVATPDVRFPSSEEIEKDGLNEDVAYAYFGINDGDQGKYPYSAIALGEKGWDVARTGQYLAVRLDDIIEADRYTRFALNSEYGIIASYSGSIDWKTIQPAVDSSLQAQDKKEYTREQSLNDVLEKQQASKDKQQPDTIVYDSTKQESDVAEESDVAQDTVRENEQSRESEVPDSTGIQQTEESSREDELDRTRFETDGRFPFYVELSTTGLRGDNGDPSDGFIAEQAKPFFEQGKRIGIKAGYAFDVADNLQLRAGLGYDHVEARNTVYKWKSNTEAVSLDLNALYEMAPDRKVSPIVMFGGGLRGYEATSETTPENRTIENTKGITPYLQGGLAARVDLGDVNLIVGVSSEVNFTDKFEAKYGGNGVINNDHMSRFSAGLEFDISTGQETRAPANASYGVETQETTKKRPSYESAASTIDDKTEQRIEQPDSFSNNQFSNVLTTGVPLNYLPDNR
ncbi:MAG: hypothetical protein ACOCZV_02550 [Nanoarchaeota archaeon]